MKVRADESSFLIAPVASIDDYVEAGGGQGLGIAYGSSPGAVIEEVKLSGLRGRGGAGFPTGAKWEAVRRDSCPTKFFVCNAAEGEPGTFKDRYLLRRNPYQVVEGAAIAAFAVGAERAYIGIKAAFEPEIAALRRATDEMRENGILGPVPLDVVPGPDEYLFGEEKALLEVIEGNAPLPRILPPYQDGLFSSMQSPNPTAVNNVETLANVPHILRNGAGWFRSFGTEASPGTMVFTLSGDVRAPGVYELPLGVPLRILVEEVGEGPAPGREVKAVFPGASAGILAAEHLDVPLDFDALRAVDSGLGSAGFVVYDDSACIVGALLAFSRFLWIESCAQCPACKAGCDALTSTLERIERGEGTEADVITLRRRALDVTDGRRCALPVGESVLVQTALEEFTDEFLAHLGTTCPRPRDLPIPKFLDYDAERGRFVYDERYRLKRPDWTYASPR